MTCGIYKITNLANDKVYIGSSKNIERRLQQHLEKLNKGKHHSIHLQLAWNRYGFDYFDVSIVQECSEENLFIAEQEWLDEWRSWEPEIGYNISKDAVAPTRGRKLNLSEQTRKEKRDHMLGNQAALGYKHTDEAKGKISAAHKGKRPSELTLEKSKEVHIKMWPGLVSPDGIVYNPIINLAEFCKEHNINCGNVQELFKGKRNQCKGWTTLVQTYVKQARADLGIKRGRRDSISKVWVGTLISPLGDVYTDIQNLRYFCEEHNLTYCCIQRLYSGKSKQYKGWFLDGNRN